MKKKITVAAISLAVGVTLLATTAFASVQSISGYEAYKEAMKNTFNGKNGTITILADISDNGNSLAKIDSVLKADCLENGQEGTMSGKTTVTMNGQTSTIENYGKDGQMVLKGAGDTYYVGKGDGMKGCERMNENDMDTAEEERVANLIMDSFMGDLKNNFTSSNNGDGTKTIGLNLEGSQIPAVLNGIVSLGIKDGAKGHHGEIRMDRNMDSEMNAEELALVKDLFGTDLTSVNTPDLVSDISVKAVRLNAIITSENTIGSQTLELVVVGKDAAGANHEISMKGNFAITDLNKTTPDQIDLTGKTVKVLEHKESTEK